MIRVTDHAVVRYLERVMGVDVARVREEIAESFESPRAMRLVEFSGGARCRVRVNGSVFCLRGETVTTCLGSPGSDKR